jgi:hypothetical protein
MTNSNPLIPKPVQGMNPEELAALNKWASDFRKVAPQLAQLASSSQGIHKAMLEAPVWRVAEGRPPGDMPRPEEKKDPFSIGAPKVNYVDHIDTSRDSHESPDTEGKQS